MRIRRVSVALLGATSILTACGVLTAQERPGNEPRYLPVTQSPAAPPVNRPRITSPVVAGAEGVRPASFNDSSTIPPPLPTIPAVPPSNSASSPPGLNRGTPPAPVLPPAAVPALPPVQSAPAAPLPLPTPPAPSLPVAPTETPRVESNWPSVPATPASLEPRPLTAPKVEMPAVVESNLTPPVGASSSTSASIAPPTQPSTSSSVLPSSSRDLPTGSVLPARQTPNVVVEVVAPESVGAGRPVTYEIVVRNAGMAAVTNVRVEDELPVKGNLIGVDPAPDQTGDRCLWTIGTLEPGAERRIRVGIRAGEEGEIKTRPIVTFSCTSEGRVKITRPKIALAITGPENARVGEKIQFQIRLTNSGTGMADHVVLQAKFSEGLAHQLGQVIEAKLANLPAGQTKAWTLETVAGRSGAQSCQLTASADGTSSESAKASVSLVEPMLQVKQTGPTRALVRSEPTYQIELNNPGTAATDPVRVTTILPAGFEVVQASDGGSFQEASRTVSWQTTPLASGTTRVLSLKLRAVAATEGVIRTVAQSVNPADVRTDGGLQAADHRPASARGPEGAAETPVKVDGVPALRFEVFDIEDPVEVGKEALYEIHVLNQGTGACTNVQVTAELDEGTAAASASGPTSGRTSGQQILFDPIPQLGVKGEAVYRVKVKGVTAGDHRFRVRVSSDQIRSSLVREENTRFFKE